MNRGILREHPAWRNKPVPGESGLQPGAWDMLAGVYS